VPSGDRFQPKRVIAFSPKCLIGFTEIRTLFTQSGVSGPTRAQSTRQDALASAAYAVAGHCRHLLADPSSHPRADVRAAREVVRWLELLDLL
jgi:hypothetical protein